MASRPKVNPPLQIAAMPAAMEAEPSSLRFWGGEGKRDGKVGLGMLNGIRRSKRTQLLLIALAALVSLVPLTAKSRQGNSIRWSVDGEDLSCEYFQIPSFSHVRTYKTEKVIGVTKAPDSKNPSIEVIRLQLDGLNLNIPSQSRDVIWNFDGYLSRLQVLLAKARAGDPDVSLTWVHPWVIVGLASIVLAVALWIVVFASILMGPPESGAATTIKET
jgi:hypothetical protein